MRTATRIVTSVIVGVALAAGLAACADEGDLSIRNTGPDDVSVDTGDEMVVVDADGGAVLLGYGCTPGDVTVTFATGARTVLSGPVCPEQEIVVGDGTADLRPAATGST